MATHLHQSSVGGDVGGKTLSTGQGELAAGFGMRSVTSREVGVVLLWDAVPKRHAHVPYLPLHPRTPWQRDAAGQGSQERGCSSCGTSVL